MLRNGSPESFGRFLKDEYEKWGKAVDLARAVKKAVDTQRL